MLDFYKNKKVFVTGHTGFKGSWLCKILIMSGANVWGFSRDANINTSLFSILNIEKDMNSIVGDIRNMEELQRRILEFNPDIIFHLAAQPLVRESYIDPIYTFETNVIGTANLLESIRKCKSIRSVINVTTDKVYENKEWEWGYRENENLNGYDPYSNSKACSELITSCYKKSFFKNKEVAISTVRAGNVIGGGDFSIDRIIPDCVRGAINNQEIILRNPESIRPYQHVFEALRAYLTLGKLQYENKNLEGSYNVGPNENDIVTTKKIVTLFCREWGNIKFRVGSSDDIMHESSYLKLDCSKIKSKISWEPQINIEEAIKLTVRWFKSYLNNEDMERFSEESIRKYFFC